MRNITVTFEDGTTHVYQNAPDDVTPEQITARASQEFGKPIASLDGGRDKFASDLSAANEAASREKMSHPSPQMKPRDMYSTQARSQGFGTNLAAGLGGAFYGLGNLGPRSLVGMDKPGEVKDWKASMAGLGDTAGGTLGQVLGYSAPSALVAPFAGASVPIAAAVGALEGALMPAESWGERGVNTVASAGGATLGQTGGNAAAKRFTARANKKTAEVSKQKSKNAVRDATLTTSKQEGYVVPPSYSGSGMFPRFFEGISGKYKTNQLAGIKNQQVTNDLARKALGLADDSPLTDANLDAYRFSVAQPYRDIAALPKRQKVRAASNYTDWDYPTQAVTGFDPAKSLEALKIARHDAKMYWKGASMTGSPETLALARQTDGIADALEQQIEQYAKQNGDDVLVNRLKDSRKQIAKSYSVERALNDGTGDVDATKLAKMLASNEILTDELEKAGKFGMAFHDVARPPKSGDANPFTIMDLWSGVGTGGMAGLAAGGPMGLLAGAALPASRVASRYSLLSGPMQRYMRPKYSIGLPNRVMPGLLDNRVSSALFPGAGIYGYGVQPFTEEEF